jgi:TetR/AcrR family transcriptional regulator, cholesterol catabolism regulator
VTKAQDPQVGSVEETTTAGRLLAAAAELFSSKGYAGTTTRELSTLLGLQSASLYYHMERKEDLLYTLCISTLDEVATAFDAVVASGFSPIEKLHDIVIRYTRLALHERYRHRTMLVELRALSEERRNEVIARRDRNFGVAQTLMSEAQVAGQLRNDIPAKYLTLGMFNLLNWSIFWYDPEGELSPDGIASLLWSIFTEGSGGRLNPTR